ncbi:hypothetical protein [Kutzneria sp. NPDC051319]|uniref:hypothetical protein n=1 Tax=Kutzneria sp. NPDC051319 TaxID=3155047 RepID=UPI0034354471
MKEQPASLIDTPVLHAGTVVVYFDPEPTDESSFGRATAMGPEVIDPRTHGWWAPITRQDGTVDLLPSTLIVGIA